MLFVVMTEWSYGSAPAGPHGPDGVLRPRVNKLSPGGFVDVAVST